MKKIFSLLLAVAATLSITTSCSDVPMPYDIFGSGDTSFGKKLPYKNASLASFSMYNLKDGAAWSQGSSYTQATGYQTWDGATSKTNKEVESYLISPALNTTCASGKVRMSFDHTLRYTNNVSGWQNYHKIFISKDYSGKTVDFDKATWTQINYTPAASTFSDWTLYESGHIAIPEEFVNHDSVYVAFYFYAPATASTTWELMNFMIEEGEAINNGDTPTPDTPVAGLGTKEAPLSVAEAKTKTSGKGYVTGYIVGYIDGTKLEEGAKFEAAAAAETEVLIADAADCKDATLVMPIQLPTGDIRTKLNPNVASNIGKKVVVYGEFLTYFGTMGIKNTSWAKIDDTEEGTDPDAPIVPVGEAKGDGTKDNPYNVAAILGYTKALAADTNSDKEFYFEGIVCDDPNIDTSSYGNATYHISDDGTSNNSFYIFRGFDIDGAKFTDAKKIKKGDKVVICGNVVNYKGNTPETVANKSHLVSINGSTVSGGTTPTTPDTGDGDKGEDDKKPDTGSTTGGLSISGTTVTLTNAAVTAGTTSVTIDLATLGYENAAPVQSVTFSDGATLTFSKGTNTNDPKFYTATNGVRVYANNILTFEGKSNIAKIEMTCDSYNGTDYVGNQTATITFDGNKAVYTNTSANAGTQLRVKTITITYAK